MTRYTVVWAVEAQDDLAEIWINARDRNTVSRAVHAIDRELAEAPSTRGWELHEGLRALFVPPLKIAFSVREEDRRVEVESVYYL